jgi:hypothetical protein
MRCRRVVPAVGSSMGAPSNDFGKLFLSSAARSAFPKSDTAQSPRKITPHQVKK